MSRTVRVFFTPIYRISRGTPFDAATFRADAHEAPLAWWPQADFPSLDDMRDFFCADAFQKLLKVPRLSIGDGFYLATTHFADDGTPVKTVRRYIILSGTPELNALKERWRGVNSNQSVKVADLHYAMLPAGVRLVVAEKNHE